MNSNVVDQALQQDSGLTPTFKRLINSIPALVASVDCSMRIQFANKRFTNWFMQMEDVSALFPVLVGKNAFRQIQRYLGNVLSGGEETFRIVLEYPNGVKFLDTHLTPNLNDDGMVTGFVFHASDTTDRNISERTLRDYFENASVGLHLVNSEGVITWANTAELRMLGYTREEYVGHNVTEFYVNSAAIADMLDPLNQHENVRNFESELICKDGSRRHVAINCSTLWGGSTVIHARCFTVDITEQKLAAQATTENHRHFETTANLVPLIIWTSDTTGNCNYLNMRWQEVTGRTIDPTHGYSWIEAIHSEDKEKIRASWLRSISLQTPFEAKFRLANKHGDYTVYYAHANPRHNALQEYIGHVGVLQDISTHEEIKSSLEKIVMERTEDLRKRNAELKAAEDSLRDKNQELEIINSQLSSFAYVASHDLQEPLRKIQTYTSRILDVESASLTEKARQYLYRVKNSADRMRMLIQDLLAYSKSTTESGNYEETNLNAIFDEVVTELELKIEEKQAIIENQGLPILKIVRFQFFQLFQNLISNSLKFSGDNNTPYVIVRSEKIPAERILEPFPKVSSTYCHIEVVDNGLGFEPEQKTKIFEVFHRLHDKDKFEGTGIGLAICKRIVENHRGVLLASGEMNVGATFHIYIPIDNVPDRRRSDTVKPMYKSSILWNH